MNHLMNDRESTLLHAIAIAEEVPDEQILSSFVKADPDQMKNMLENLRSKNFLSFRNGHYIIEKSTIHEIRGEMGENKLRQNHRKLAMALEKSGCKDKKTIAIHYKEAMNEPSLKDSKDGIDFLKNGFKSCMEIGQISFEDFDYLQAIDFYEAAMKAEGILRNVHEEVEYAELRGILQRLGRAYTEGEINRNKARDSLNRLNEIAKAFKDQKTEINSLMNLMRVEVHVRPEIAESIYNKGMELIDNWKTDDETLINRYKAHYYHNLGIAIENLDNRPFTETVSLYKQGLDIILSLKDNESWLIEIYSDMLQPLAALGEFKDNKNIILKLDKMNISEPFQEAHIAFNKGINYYSMGDFKTAMNYFHETIIISNEKFIIPDHYALGVIYFTESSILNIIGLRHPHNVLKIKIDNELKQYKEARLVFDKLKDDIEVASGRARIDTLISIINNKCDISDYCSTASKHMEKCGATSFYQGLLFFDIGYILKYMGDSQYHNYFQKSKEFFEIKNARGFIERIEEYLMS